MYSFIFWGEGNPCLLLSRIMSVDCEITKICMSNLILIFGYSLPWQGLKAATKKQKYDKICEKKLSTPIEVRAYFMWCSCMLIFELNFLKISSNLNGDRELILAFLFVLEGSVQISSCWVCLLLALLPLFDIRTASWLWILKTLVPWIIYPRRYNRIMVYFDFVDL